MIDGVGRINRTKLRTRPSRMGNRHSLVEDTPEIDGSEDHDGDDGQRKGCFDEGPPSFIRPSSTIRQWTPGSAVTRQAGWKNRCPIPFRRHANGYC